MGNNGEKVFMQIVYSGMYVDACADEVLGEGPERCLFCAGEHFSRECCSESLSDAEKTFRKQFHKWDTEELPESEEKQQPIAESEWLREVQIAVAQYRATIEDLSTTLQMAFAYLPKEETEEHVAEMLAVSNRCYRTLHQAKETLTRNERVR